MPDKKNIIGGILIIGASSIYNIYGSKIRNVLSKSKDRNDENLNECKDNQSRQPKVNQSRQPEVNQSRSQVNPLELKSREELISICNQFNDQLNLKNQEMQVVMHSYHNLQKEVATLNNMVINQKLSK